MLDKCEDCEYVEKTLGALDVHIGTYHHGKVYCGLCENS